MHTLEWWEVIMLVAVSLAVSGVTAWLRSVSSKRRDEAMERHPSTGPSISLADRDIQIHHGLTREQWQDLTNSERADYRNLYYKTMGI